MNDSIDTSKPCVYDYATGALLREATPEELAASKLAAESDGGAGVIIIDGRPCYVVE